MRKLSFTEAGNMTLAGLLNWTIEAFRRSNNPAFKGMPETMSGLMIYLRRRRGDITKEALVSLLAECGLVVQDPDKEVYVEPEVPKLGGRKLSLE